MFEDIYVFDSIDFCSLLCACTGSRVHFCASFRVVTPPTSLRNHKRGCVFAMQDAGCRIQESMRGMCCDGTTDYVDTACVDADYLC